MSVSRLTPLVSTKWLKNEIFSSLQNTNKLSYSYRVLDTSWLPEPNIDGYKQFYLQAHIPTALYFDLKKLSPPSVASAAKFPIPDSNVFKDYVENLGINNGTHVIAYDRFNSRSSLRTWYLFRLFGHDSVSVLNGGLKQWLTDGFHVTMEEPDVEHSCNLVFKNDKHEKSRTKDPDPQDNPKSNEKKQVFSINFRKHLLRDFESMLTNVDTKAEQLMDARASNSFCPPEEGSPGGHIPGAKNIPYDSLFSEDGTFKSKEDLKKIFAEAGIDLNKPLVSSCQTGMTACGLILAAYMLGKNDVPLYNGSFTEWSQLADSSKIVRKKQS